MSGDLDYLIKAVVKDMAGYDELYKELIKADCLMSAPACHGNPEINHRNAACLNQPEQLSLISSD